MAKLTAVYDSCTLYPAPLRDLLMWLALTDLYRAKWTNEIHEEWIRNLLLNRGDLTRSQLERTRDRMNAHVRDCLVEGYESHIPKLQLPDPDDRHVLAAAIHARAHLIITFNLRDFPKEALDPWKVEAIHPDRFILRLLELDEVKVCESVREQRESLRNPPRSVEEHLDTLERQGLVESVARLRVRARHL